VWDYIFLVDNALSYAEIKKQWMVLRDNFFTLDGNECNKIGVSYSGFRNQPGQKCNEPQNTCLASQIKDYWDVSIFQLNLYLFKKIFFTFKKDYAFGLSILLIM